MKIRLTPLSVQRSKEHEMDAVIQRVIWSRDQYSSSKNVLSISYYLLYLIQAFGLFSSLFYSWQQHQTPKKEN